MSLLSKKRLSRFFFFVLLFFFTTHSAQAVDIVRINEFSVHPTDNAEWVEFYNPDRLDLTAYFIDDDTDFINDTGNGGKKPLSAILKQNTTQYPYIELSSLFNNSGDSIVLFASSGAILDQYTYSEDPGEEVILGRSPDGTGVFDIMQTGTKGQQNSNYLPTPTPTPTITPSPTRTPTPSPTEKPTVTPTPISVTEIQKLSPTPEEIIAHIEAAQARFADYDTDASLPTLPEKERVRKITPTPTILREEKPQSNALFFLLLGLGFLILAGTAGYTLFRYRQAKLNQ